MPNPTLTPPDNDQHNVDDKFNDLIGHNYSQQELQDLEHKTAENAGEQAGDTVRDHIRDRLGEGRQHLQDRATDHLKEQGKNAVKKGISQGAKQGASNLAGEGAGAAASGAAGAGGAAAAGTGAAAAGAGAAAAGGGAAAGAGGAAAAGAAAGSVAPGVGTAIGAGVGAAASAMANKKVRRAVLIGGPAIGAMLIIGAFFVFVLILQTFKPALVIADMSSKAYDKIKTIVDYSSVGILGNYIVQASSGALAWQAETNTVATDGGKVAAVSTAAKGELGELFNAMNTDGMQARLDKNFGIKFIKGSRPGYVAIMYKGKKIGEANTPTGALDVLRKSTFGQAGINDITEREFKAWNYTKHIQLAQNQKTDYQINQLNVPGADNANNNDAVTDVMKTSLTTLNQPSVGQVGDLLSCFITGCGNGSGVGDESSSNTVEAAASSSFDASLSQLDPKKDYVVDTVRTGAQKQLKKDAEENSTSFIAWLDTAAGIRKAAVGDDPNSTQKVVDARKNQAGRIASFWETASQQYLASAMTKDAAEAFFSYFKDIESSKAYCLLNSDNQNCGKGLPDWQKINEINKNAISILYQTYTAGQKTVASFALDKVLQTWTTFREKTPAGIIINAIEKVPVLKLLADTSIFNLVFNITKDNLNDVLDQTYGLGGDTVLPTYDGAQRGGTFIDTAFAGFQTIARDEGLKHFGATNITVAQASEIYLAQEKQQKEQIAQAPWTERFFSITSPNSFWHAAIVQSPIPYGATSNITSGVSAILQLPATGLATIGNMIAQPTHAATLDLTTLNGIANAGIPLSILQKAGVPIELMSEGGNCPTTQMGELNVCAGFKAVIDSLIPYYKHTLNQGVVAGVSGEVGAPVDYSKLYKKIPAGTVPANMLCNLPGYGKGIKLLCGSPVASFNAMNDAYKKVFGSQMPVGQGYRSAEEQKAANAAGKGTFATYDPNYYPPGHLWGTAIDFGSPIDSTNSAQHKWLEKNGPQFGWFWPNWAKNGTGGAGNNVFEPWHFNYYGKNHNPASDDVEGLPH